MDELKPDRSHVQWACTAGGAGDRACAGRRPWGGAGMCVQRTVRKFGRSDQRADGWDNPGNSGQERKQADRTENIPVSVWDPVRPVVFVSCEGIHQDDQIFGKRTAGADYEGVGSDDGACRRRISCGTWHGGGWERGRENGGGHRFYEEKPAWHDTGDYPDAWTDGERKLSDWDQTGLCRRVCVDQGVASADCGEDERNAQDNPQRFGTDRQRFGAACLCGAGSGWKLHAAGSPGIGADDSLWCHDKEYGSERTRGGSVCQHGFIGRRNACEGQ